MGLSFHYSGKIRSVSAIDLLTSEVEDICKSLGWEYYIWKRKSHRKKKIKNEKGSVVKYTPEDVTGIDVTPPDSETLFLTFLPDGTLCSPVKLMFYNPENNDLLIEVIHTKTQFAGPDVHITLMELLRYLEGKYFQKLKVDDEGMYWGRWDKEVLLARFETYNKMFNLMSEALTTLKAEPGETVTQLANRLEAYLRRRLSGSNDK
jgi:hypothetical protein